MSTTDVIPDLHGQSAKLAAALARLGWQRRGTGWRHADPGRRILFLGDYIDRGPDNAGTIAVVRQIVDSGRGTAIMGNHELNALQFHRLHPETGRPLRPRSDKNTRQHARFLAEFPLGERRTAEVLDWMGSLPTVHDGDGFRAVHAAWTDPAVAGLRRIAPDARLDDGLLLRSADPADPLHGAVETLLKGPEVALPQGHAIVDKDGTSRTAMRIRWWTGGTPTWRMAALSVPDPDSLPDGPLDASGVPAYPADAPPVFFGHYWLTGAPLLQAANALCLDYSAGRDGPLVTYRHESGAPLSLDRLQVHPAPA